MITKIKNKIIDFIWDVVCYLYITVVILFLIAVFYVMVIMFPVDMVNNHRCLKLGYPQSYTSILLDGYCKNEDGELIGNISDLEAK